MSGQTGYTLDQLLDWCTQAHLIEGFAVDGESVFIIQGGIERELDHVTAKQYLKGMFSGLGRRMDREFRDGESNLNIA